jgi:hypothetical protein
MADYVLISGVAEDDAMEVFENDYYW